MKKPALFLGLALLALVMLFTLGDVFSLENIQTQLDAIRDWRAQNWLGFTLGFMALYVLLVALSLPFATALTLLAGAICGFWQGLVMVSLASTIGATMAFLASRYLFQGTVRKQFGQRLQAIDEGFKKDGAFYLFTLRMVPLFPFFAVNLLMGLTSISTARYFIVSLIGMLPGTAVYVYAGRNLGELQSYAGILSPQMIISFSLLGFFPLIARFIIGKINARRVYEPYDKPAKFDRNLIVIGAGSAGLVSAYMGASLNAKVTLVEAGKMGGDCLNTGCVPSKALIKAAHIRHDAQNADRYGIKPSDAAPDWPALISHVNQAIQTIEPHDSVERYEGLGVDVALGKARILDPWRVEITPHQGEAYTLTTRSIVIASGAAPFVPPIKGLDKINYLTSENLWETLSKNPTPPQRLMVLGGGVIGTELAQAFSRLGLTITLVEMADHLLEREDEEVSKATEEALIADGVEVLCAHKAVEFQDGIAILEHKGQTIQKEFDAVLVAVGRQARLQGFGLEALGVEVDRTITTNAYLETNFPNIYAAGDVAGPYQLTHAAGYQGTYAALNALLGGLWRFKTTGQAMPSAIFTAPEIARIGLNEKDAKAQNIPHEVTRYDLSDLDRAIAEGENHGFIKILTKKGSDKILGVTIFGSHAGDLISEFALAMNNGIGLRKILGTIHPYPTWAEAAKNSAGLWQKAHINVHLTRFMGWFMEKRRG